MGCVFVWISTCPGWEHACKCDPIEAFKWTTLKTNITTITGGFVKDVGGKNELLNNKKQHVSYEVIFSK